MSETSIINEIANSKEKKTLVLFDNPASTVASMNLPKGSVIPEVALYQGKIYLLRSSGGFDKNTAYYEYTPATVVEVKRFN